ncbi:Probable aspartic protease At2g35615 [Linum perenne]
MSSSLSLAFFFSILIFSTSYGANITVPLIHRDSVYSPLYNASETISDRAQRIVEASRGRHDYLSLLFSDDHEHTPSLSDNGSGRVDAELVNAIKFNIFYANFSIGYPPVPQLGIMDTGSSFLWVKCLPCSPCSPSSGGTFFDPTKSKTYVPRPCTKECSKLNSGWFTKYCKYTITYAGGQTSEGVEATEQLRFQVVGGPAVVVPNFQIGCSSSLTGTEGEDQHFNGILPLGIEHHKNSLVAMFGYKFSYCVGSIVDRSNLYNHLSIGDGAYLQGDSSTPLQVKYGKYFVFVSHITLNDKAMDIGSDVMTKFSYYYGVEIDSGAELSFLYTEVFDVVKAEVSKMAESLLVGVPAKSPYELCYKGSVYREARDFPPIGIQFVKEGELILDNFGMFKQVEDDKFCLAFLRTDSVSLIGMMAQQGYNIGYDLVRKRLYIKDTDCLTV